MNNQTSTKPFTFYNHYYDLLYHDKDYKKEAEHVVHLIRKFTSGATNILELGSGTGNYAKCFCEAGLNVTGIEISDEMSAIADAKAIKGFNTVTNDITDFDLEQQYDGAVALFHVISYLVTNERIIQCFNRVNKHLKPGSVFIFDVWYTPAVYIQSPHKTVKEVRGQGLTITRVAEPSIKYDENTVEVKYEMNVYKLYENQPEVLKETHTLRHFSTPEIKLFAGLTGFTFLGAEEFLTAKTPGADTWGVCYILQKHA